MGAVATLRVSPTARRAYRSISAALRVAYAKNKPVHVDVEPGRYAFLEEFSFCYTSGCDRR